MLLQQHVNGVDALSRLTCCSWSKGCPYVCL